MPWSELRFGKHSGKTLPQVIFSDPDWFFWAIDNKVFDNKGPLVKKEAADIERKATSIRIPNNADKKLVAEYIIHSPTGKFARMQIIPADRGQHQGSSPTFRSDVIDMSAPRQFANYDKLGGNLLVSSVKFALFGDKSAKMTRKRCDDFFDNARNFENVKSPGAGLIF